MVICVFVCCAVETFIVFCAVETLLSVVYGILLSLFLTLLVLAFLIYHRYDMEAIYFEEGVRNSRRHQLESRALDV